MERQIDIRKTLTHNKIRQGELAAYLGVSKGYISQVLSGKSKFSAESLVKLAKHPEWEIVYLPEKLIKEPESKEGIVRYDDVIVKLTDENSRLISIIEEQLQVIKNLSSK